MPEWYYMVDGFVKGPISHGEMAENIVSEKLASDTLAWTKSMEKWRSVKDIDLFKDMFLDSSAQVTLFEREIKSSETDDGPLDDTIIKDDDLTCRISTDTPRPWVRFWARAFDYTSFGCFAGFFAGIFIYMVDPLFMFSKICGITVHILLMGSWIFVEAYMLSVWGTTIGKWLLGISVSDHAGNKLSYNAALKRSLQVWVKGLVFGLPIISWFGIIHSYEQLCGEWKKTSWDLHGGHVVQHKKLNFFGVAMVVIVLTALFYLNNFIGI